MGIPWSDVRWWARFARRLIAARLGLAGPLPPGRLDGSALVRHGDHRFFLRQTLRYGPVFKVLWSRRVAVCVVGLERGRALLARHSPSLQPRAMEIDDLVPLGFLRRMRGADHRHYRARFLTALRSDLVDGCEGTLRSIISEALSGMAVQQTSASADPDRLRDTLDRMAGRLLLTVAFGFPTDAPEFERLERGFVTLQSWTYPRTAVQNAAYRELVIATRTILASRPVDPPLAPKDTSLSRLAQASKDGVLDDTTIGNLIFMLDTGRYDVRALFRWLVKHLSDNPEAAHAVRRQHLETPHGAITPALACVLETLRLEQAESINRDVLEDIDVDGYQVPRGSALRILMRESHQNAETFADPEVYKPCRWVRLFGPDVYSPFGLGEHRCPANELVLRIATLFVEELVRGYRWEVTGDGPPHHGRYHWEPSPDFGIRLEPRSLD